MKKRKLVFMLEYKSYPLWVYDEEDTGCDPVLPEELKGHMEIETLMEEIQDIFDSLFTDEPQKRFSFNGFPTAVEELEFKEKLDIAYQLVETIVGGKYTLINRFGSDFSPTDFSSHR